MAITALKGVAPESSAQEKLQLLMLRSPEGRNLGTAMVSREEDIEYIDGMQLEVDGRTVTVRNVIKPSGMDSSAGTEAMSTQDRYIDARLTGIESKLDARMEAMQRFQEQAESRFLRATERHETDLALARQQIHEEFRDARKHATNTAWATVGGVLAAIALLVGIGGYWISEQGSYARSYGETQAELQEAASERSEFREAVQSIQATQQSILERLPSPEAGAAGD